MTWTVEESRFICNSYRVRDEDGDIIASLLDLDRAELIASAPQLAEENEALLALLREWFEVGQTSGLRCLGIMARTRAALDMIEKGEK